MATGTCEAAARVTAARTKPCPRTVRKGRLRKAEQFWLAAAASCEQLEDEAVGDAFVTLCIHARIAAADVACCAALREHARGEARAEAVALLQRADPTLRNDLGTLLAMKTRSATATSSPVPTPSRRASGLPAAS